MEPNAELQEAAAAPRMPNGADGVHHGPQPAARLQQEAEVTVASETVEGFTEAAEPAQDESAAERIALFLPPSVVSRADVSRCLREVTVLNDFFHQAAIRGSQAQNVPTLSKTLEGLAAANGLNLIHAEDRAKLKDFLTKVKNKAPVVHLSFPSEASDAFIAKLLEWFRREVDPFVVLHIGLQPELAAGCIVRTTNKLFDFSFRQRFANSKAKLIIALEAMNDAPDRTVLAGANDSAPAVALSADMMQPEAQSGEQKA